jgi:hypothetical protein
MDDADLVRFQENLTHLVPIQRGSWLYDGVLPCEVRIVRHDVRLGSRDLEDPPEVAQDQNVEWYYVLTSTPTRPSYWVTLQSAPSLDDAIACAERALGSKLTWNDR